MPYPRVANQFIDPIPTASGGIGTYSWHVNHFEEEGPFRSSNVQFDGRSDGQGVVATAGEWEPLILNLSGTILHRQQHINFWKFRHIDRSFRYIDFDGNEYEVSMIAYEPKKKRVALNMNDSTMKTHVIEYTMQLWIMNVIDGDLDDAQVPE